MNSMIIHSTGDCSENIRGCMRILAVEGKEKEKEESKLEITQDIISEARCESAILWV